MQLASPATPSLAPARAAEPPSLGWMLLLAAALFALALPIVGPLDDHHFAERTHTHQHIYLNGRPVAHGHAYESGPSHLHATVSQPPSGTTGIQPDGVLFLAPATASLMLAALSAPYNTPPEELRPPAPRAKDTNPLTPFGNPATPPDGAPVAPPLPPPIV